MVADWAAVFVTHPWRETAREVGWGRGGGLFRWAVRLWVYLLMGRRKEDWRHQRKKKLMEWKLWRAEKCVDSKSRGENLRPWSSVYKPLVGTLPVPRSLCLNCAPPPTGAWPSASLLGPWGCVGNKTRPTLTNASGVSDLSVEIDINLKHVVFCLWTSLEA